MSEGENIHDVDVEVDELKLALKKAESERDDWYARCLLAQVTVDDLKQKNFLDETVTMHRTAAKRWKRLAKREWTILRECREITRKFREEGLLECREVGCIYDDRGICYRCEKKSLPRRCFDKAAETSTSMVNAFVSAPFVLRLSTYVYALFTLYGCFAGDRALALLSSFFVVFFSYACCTWKANNDG